VREKLEAKEPDERERKKIPARLRGTNRALYKAFYKDGLDDDGAVVLSSFNSITEMVIAGRGEENSQVNRTRISKKPVADFGTHLLHAGKALLLQQLHSTVMLNPEKDLWSCATTVAKKDLRLVDPDTGKPYADAIQATSLFDQGADRRGYANRQRQLAN